MAVEMYLWAYVLYMVLLLFSIERIMNLFFEKRKSPLLLLFAALLLFGVASGVVFLFFNLTWLTACVNIAALFIISLNYEASLIRRIAGVIGSFFIISTIGVFIAALNQYYFNFTHGIQEISPVTFISVGVSTYLIVLLLSRFRNIRKFHFVPTPIFLVSLTVPILSYVLVLLSLNLPWYIASITIVILFIINLVFFYYQDTLAVVYQDKLRLALDSQEKVFYFSQCQLMQESVEQVKSIRHDMKLHLATAINYNANKKADELTDYLKNLLGDIGKSEVYSDTGNIAFDSIINFKLKNATDDNIKLDVTVFVSPTLNIEAVDVVTILGNLLDNALDAVAKVEDKRIKLNVKLNKGNLVIKVENTFDGKVKYAKGKDGPERTIGTRKDGSDHGHGLNNIRKSVEKYDGHVDISHEDNVFSASVLLYVDDV